MIEIRACAAGFAEARWRADVRPLLPLPRLSAADGKRQRADRDRPDRAAGGRAPRVVVPTNSDRPHRIFRCATCQTAMWSEYGGIETLRFVRVGTLDDPTAPNVHTYVRSKLPWGILPEGVPSFEAYYDSQKLWLAVSLKRRSAILG